VSAGGQRRERIASSEELLDPADARATLDTLAAQIEQHPTTLVLAHDPALLDRFARGQLTSLAPGP
jgi:hypothetical protein